MWKWTDEFERCRDVRKNHYEELGLSIEKKKNGHFHINCAINHRKKEQIGRRTGLGIGATGDC